MIGNNSQIIPIFCLSFMLFRNSLRLFWKLIKMLTETYELGQSMHIAESADSSAAEVMDNLIAQMEEENMSKYVSRTKDKDYGNSEWQPRPTTRVYWEHPKANGSVEIPFDGIPFMFVGRKVLACHYGQDSDKFRKEKRARQRESLEEQLATKAKRRKMIIPSKKIGCPAQIYIVQIAKFPGYKITNDSERNRKDTSAKLRHNLACNVPVEFSMVFMSRATEHRGHPVSGQIAGYWELLDGIVLEKIKSLTCGGIQKASEMRMLLDAFVKQELFRGEAGPLAMHRHFYPSDKELKTYIADFRNATWDSIIDQANLENLIETWNKEQPYDSSCFRPRKARKAKPEKISRRNGLIQQCLARSQAITDHIPGLANEDYLQELVVQLNHIQDYVMQRLPQEVVIKEEDLLDDVHRKDLVVAEAQLQGEQFAKIYSVDVNDWYVVVWFVS